MDFWDLARVMWRRWVIVVPMLLATVAAVVWTSQHVPPDYQVSGHVILIPPTQTTATSEEAARAAAARNPWLDMGASSLAQAVAVSVQKQSVRDEVVAAGLDPEYVILVEGQSPFIDIEVTASSEERARNTVHYVVDLVGEELRLQQEQFGADENTMITVLTLDEGETVTTVTSKVKRLIAVVGAAGMILAAAAAILLDAVLRWRRNRRTSPPERLATRATFPPPPLATQVPVALASAVLAQATGTANPAGIGSSTALGTATGVPRPTGIARPGGLAGPAGLAAANEHANGRQMDRGTAPEEARPDAATEEPDSTIVLPLSGVPWAGRGQGTPDP